jgi:hypothetical protein
MRCELARNSAESKLIEDESIVTGASKFVAQSCLGGTTNATPDRGTTLAHTEFGWEAFEDIRETREEA